MGNCFLRFFLFLLVLLFSCSGIYAQKNFEFSGYLSELPSVTWSSDNSQNGFNNIVHNRLNLVYYNSSQWTTDISVRNRFISGQLVDDYANFQYIIGNDEGFLDMSFNWGGRNNHVLNSSFDRLSVDYVNEKFQLKFGRQRINWGLNSVWNPNDIFNTYSYFDFDYPERSGVDALRLQYYLNPTSLLDAAVKIDRYNQVTAALRYKFNVKGYDIQFMTGELNQEELILGTGWSGHISHAGFYGELTYLKSYSDSDYNGVITAIGGNYSFKNGTSITSEWLYMSKANSLETVMSSFYYSPSSVKDLSIGNYSYLLSATYPITPLLRVSVSYVGFDFPVMQNYYLGPNIDYSISDNISASAYMQYFSLKTAEYDFNNNTVFLRLKINF